MTSIVHNYEALAQGLRKLRGEPEPETSDAASQATPPNALEQVLLGGAGGAKTPGDEQHWKGQAHDLLAIDEASSLTNEKIEWLSTTLKSELAAEFDYSALFQQYKRLQAIAKEGLDADEDWVLVDGPAW